MNGLVFVIALVAVGLGATAGLYRWRASSLGEDFRRTRAEMPQDPEKKLELWLMYGGPFVAQRLEQMRYSREQPWLLTHTLGAQRNAAEQEIWGVDLTGLAPAWTAREGMEIVVTLPKPRKLGAGAISGDKALNVPHVSPGAAFDAEKRARAIVLWSIEKLIGSLEKDNPGAKLVVRFAERTPSGG
jgi:hypothetical protein